MALKQLRHATGFSHVRQQQNLTAFGFQRSPEDIHPASVLELQVAVHTFAGPELALHDVGPAARQEGPLQEIRRPGIAFQNDAITVDDQERAGKGLQQTRQPIAQAFFFQQLPMALGLRNLKALRQLLNTSLQGAVALLELAGLKIELGEGRFQRAGVEMALLQCVTPEQTSLPFKKQDACQNWIC